MGRIAEEEREKLHVRLDKIEQIFYINSGDFIPKSRKYKCTNGAQTLVVWAFSNFVENLRTTISKKSLCNINKFLSVYNLVKVAAWQSSNIGCFFVAYF